MTTPHPHAPALVAALLEVADDPHAVARLVELATGDPADVAAVLSGGPTDGGTDGQKTPA